MQVANTAQFIIVKIRIISINGGMSRELMDTSRKKDKRVN